MTKLRLCLLLMLIAVFSTGCHKRRPKVLPPAPPQSAPQTAPSVVLPQPIPPLPQVATTRPAPVTSAPAQTPKKSSHRTTRNKPKPAPTQEPAKTSATATPPPPLSAPEITTSTSGPDAKRETEDLLKEADAAIERLTRQRTPNGDETNTIQQIRSFEKDARDAVRLEDYIRAHTLAQKAHLLAVTLRP